MAIKNKMGGAPLPPVLHSRRFASKVDKVVRGFVFFRVNSWIVPVRGETSTIHEITRIKHEQKYAWLEQAFEGNQKENGRPRRATQQLLLTPLSH